MRTAKINRKTFETEVNIEINLDGSSRHQIDSGLPFLDHMLAQVSLHGLFDLTLEASGDLEIDSHHTVEDVGIALGQAVSQALADRKGIVRMGSARVPMDEAIAQVTLDLSGRSYSVFEFNWAESVVGGLPVSLITHFFESFASAAKTNLHAAIPYGRNGHHQAEALFKAFARALDQASAIDPRRQDAIPSTKGQV